MPSVDSATARTRLNEPGASARSRGNTAASGTTGSARATLRAPAGTARAPSPNVTSSTTIDAPTAAWTITTARGPDELTIATPTAWTARTATAVPTRTRYRRRASTIAPTGTWT